MENKKEAVNLTEKLNSFIFNWSLFPIDLWWRRRYKIPFGSPQHRAVSWIDMAIEYQEELLWNKNKNRIEEVADEEMESYIDSQLEGGKEIIEVSKEEIDEDYKNLDLDDFDNM